MADAQTTARVVARAAAKNVAVVTMDGAKVAPTPRHQDAKVTQRRYDELIKLYVPIDKSHLDAAKVTQRRRDPSRPGHFLDDAPVSASAQATPPEPTQSPRVEPSATAPISAHPTPPEPSQYNVYMGRVDTGSTAPISAHPARLGPYAKLGDKPLADKQPGPDAFLSQSAFDALEGWVNSMVDARLAARTEGANAKATQERATAARDQFAANFVK